MKGRKGRTRMKASRPRPKNYKIPTKIPVDFDWEGEGSLKPDIQPSNRNLLRRVNNNNVAVNRLRDEYITLLSLKKGYDPLEAIDQADSTRYDILVRTGTLQYRYGGRYREEPTNIRDLKRYDWTFPRDVKKNSLYKSWVKEIKELRKLPYKK